MPRTGTFGGFSFDPEVFSDYMSEQPTWNESLPSRERGLKCAASNKITLDAESLPSRERGLKSTV